MLLIEQKPAADSFVSGHDPAQRDRAKGVESTRLSPLRSSALFTSTMKPV
jgi:hypothetical protein